MSKINGKLLGIQSELKAPKNQYNAFGKYNYRNQEDILEAVKPLCNKWKATLTLSDEMVLVGNRIYVKATAKLIDYETGDFVEVSAFAREPESQKGMNEAQITGSASSYARKYCLNGLFCIDDTKDADTQDNRPQQTYKDPILNEQITEPYPPQGDDTYDFRICECGNEVPRKISKAGKEYYKCNSCDSWVN